MSTEYSLSFFNYLFYCRLRLPFFQGPPGPPGLPGRPGMFNCPKGVSTSTQSLTRSPDSSIIRCVFCISVLTFPLLPPWSLKTVFPIPPRPHCKMAVGVRLLQNALLMKHVFHIRSYSPLNLR